MHDLDSIEVDYHIVIHPEPLYSLPLAQIHLYQCTTPLPLNAIRTVRQKI